MTYQEQIKHPKWQKKRLEILELDNYKCQFCSNDQNTLHVHHLNYHKNKMIWEYDNSYLVTYCESCHNKWHKLMDEIKEILAVNLFVIIEYHEILKLLEKFDISKMFVYQEIIKLINERL